MILRCFKLSSRPALITNKNWYTGKGKKVGAGWRMEILNDLFCVQAFLKNISFHKRVQFRTQVTIVRNEWIPWNTNFFDKKISTSTCKESRVSWLIQAHRHNISFHKRVHCPNCETQDEVANIFTNLLKFQDFQILRAKFGTKNKFQIKNNREQCYW